MSSDLSIPSLSLVVIMRHFHTGAVPVPVPKAESFGVRRYVSERGYAFVVTDRASGRWSGFRSNDEGAHGGRSDWKYIIRP